MCKFSFLFLFLVSCERTVQQQPLDSSAKSIITERLRPVKGIAVELEGKLKSPKHENSGYSWVSDSEDCIETRFHPPKRFKRTKGGAYSEWLRHLPLMPKGTPVRTYSGQLKGRQNLHQAVIDIDIGKKNLQQCADAVIRLRAEYLYSKNLTSNISFNFTSGDTARWVDWMRGIRPIISGNSVSWKAKKQRDTSYQQFRSYLDTVFMYAGTLSLSRDMQTVDDPQVGDALIQGGSPGHAVIIVDTCESSEGEKMLMLAQSYMPAQNIHVLKNMNEPRLGVWHRWVAGGAFPTAEWNFHSRDLKRFTAP